MTILSRIKYIIAAIRAPVMVVRLIDRDGTKRVIVIHRTLFGCKALGKFEVTQEFSTDSFLPNWEPIEFTTPNDFREKETPAPESEGSVNEVMITVRPGAISDALNYLSQNSALPPGSRFGKQ